MQVALDDETTLAPEDETPKEDVEKEISSLEDDANLPIEEVIRRMKARAAEAGDDDDEEEEEEFDDEGEEEDDEDEDEDEEDEDDGEGGGCPGPAHTYYGANNLVPPALIPYVKLPRYLPRHVKRLTDTAIWLGPPGVGTPLHRDLQDNLLCQLFGYKKVTLVARLLPSSASLFFLCKKY